MVSMALTKEEAASKSDCPNRQTGRMPWGVGRVIAKIAVQFNNQIFELMGHYIIE